MYNKNEFEGIMQRVAKGKYKTMITSVVSLIAKLEEKNIEDDALREEFDILLDNMQRYFDGDTSSRRSIGRVYTKITEHAKTKYNLEQRGNIQGTYIAIFAGAGVALGTAFMSTLGSTYIGVGIAIGAGLGAAVGASLERKAEEEGRLY